MGLTQLGQFCHSQRNSQERAALLLLTNGIVFKRNKLLARCWASITVTALCVVIFHAPLLLEHVVSVRFVWKMLLFLSAMLLGELCMVMVLRALKFFVIRHHLEHVVLLKHVQSYSKLTVFRQGVLIGEMAQRVMETRVRVLQALVVQKNRALLHLDQPVMLQTEHF